MTRNDLSGPPDDTAAGRAAMRKNGEGDVVAIVRDAVRRDTLENLRSGKRLVRGQWVATEDYLKTRLRSRSRDVLLMIEAIVFWGVVASVGLVCLMILTLIM